MRRLATLLLIVFTGASVASAETQQRAMPPDREIRELAARDPVLQRDLDAFTAARTRENFGVNFRPHRMVCDASGDEVHCDARVVTDGRGNPDVTPKVVSGTTPVQLLRAYNLSGLAVGTPIIAIVDAYDNPNIANDLQVYSATMGIPGLPMCSGTIANSATPCFKKVNQRGSSSPPSRNQGWGLEIAHDVEAAHAVCQNCSILLVEASSASYSNLMAAVDMAVGLGATVVSNSYGSNEFSGETSYDSHFNRPGIAFTVSSGDNGYGVEYPAASRYVTAVGGTSLYFNPDGSYNSEAAWGGAGSGCSSYESKPSWQTDSNCARRTVADISAVADPNTGAAVYDSYGYGGQKGWFVIGGTSLAAPVIAAVYALGGAIPAGAAANSLPYASPSSLHDITVGSNGSCGGIYLCTSLSGFDGPTGLGTPNGVGAF